TLAVLQAGVIGLLLAVILGILDVDLGSKRELYLTLETAGFAGIFVFLFSFDTGLSKRLLGNRLMMLSGECSFSMYLLNIPIIYAALAGVGGGGGAPRPPPPSQQFDPGRRDHALRAEWGIEGEGFAAIYVGRIANEKNLPLAVQAFRKLQQIRPKARFVWVGDGPAREKIAHENPDFIFCGVQRGEALARHFASGDLFLFPSRSETFGNVTLEAMASGVATVAFDYGAAREYLRNDHTGAAVDTDANFIQAAVALTQDDALRRRLGAAAAHAMKKLHPDNVVSDFDALLLGITAARGRYVVNAA
ncbi:glycosyltransferase, partial [Xanthomonas vesicatoria ATCC 35937]